MNLNEAIELMKEAASGLLESEVNNVNLKVDPVFETGEWQGLCLRRITGVHFTFTFDINGGFHLIKV